MATQITGTQVTVTTGSANLVGRRWDFTPLMPWSGDSTPEAVTYISENTGKVGQANTWLGVRYAEPPIGNNRFRAAIDYDYPAGTYDLAAFPKVPFQSYSEENGTVGRPEWGVSNGNWNWRGMGTSESEDCLTLNIWAPVGTPPVGGWPVVFWIHGGGWTVNSAIAYHQRGHRMAARGVIVVVPGYRLSSFGYFHHPDWELEVDWDGPNLALTDIKSALRWVNRHIADFGGNTAKVMLSGSSAGGQATICLQEDTSISALFSSAWSVSGGGIGRRWESGRREWSEGYAARYARFARAVQASAGYMRDYSDPSRTVADAITANGMAWALRNAISPKDILAFSDGRNRITLSSLESGSAAYQYRSSLNIYPFLGNGLTYSSTIEAAKAGAYTKPIVISAAENEASVTNLSTINPDGFARLLNVHSQKEWMDSPWANPAWSDTQQRRLIYNHSIFQYPAWRTARAVFETGGDAWLVLQNFNGTGTGYANHTGEVQLIFGNVEWAVAMSGSEAKVTARALLMAESLGQLFINMAANQDPNIAYVWPERLELFTSPPVFSLASYDTAEPGKWNVVGNVLGDATSAPVSITHANWYNLVWPDYLARNG